jgi:hypothetical protein
MKYTIPLLIVGVCSSPITQAQTTTDGIACDYSQSTFNRSESVNVTSQSGWSCSNDKRKLTANGLPDHAVGEFPNANNPNGISEQNISATFPLIPKVASTATQLGGPRGAQGYVLNGIKIDASTAGSCDDSGSDCSMINPSGNWHIEALGPSSFNFGTDDNNAHVQPGGEYHYHGIPEGFVSLRGGNNSTITLIAWAADGFPIYARYGYSVASDSTSTIRAMTGSYQLLSTPLASRPSADTFALGTFKEDWEYVHGSGDLDECNGRVGVTPEFPDGIYHYYATDSYPYFQRCVKGEVDVSTATQAGNGVDRGRPNFAAAAHKLGISERVLMEAIGGPPPNFNKASSVLGIPVAKIQDAVRSSR